MTSTTTKPEADRLTRSLAERIFEDAQPDATDSSLRLSALVEDFVNHHRAEGRNLRVDFGYPRYPRDLYTYEGLDAFHKDLSDAVADRDVAACDIIAAVGLVALHCARFDWNFAGAETATGWVGRALPTDTGIEDLVALRVAKETIAISKPPDEHDEDPQMPRVSVIEALHDSINKATSGGTDDDKLRTRLKFWLAESLAAMPPSLLGSEKGERYRDLAMRIVDPMLTDTDDLSHVSPQMRARANYIAAAIDYANEDIDRARFRIRSALDLTNGSDIPLIERCQHRLDFLNQEQASRKSNEARIRERVTEDVEKITQQRVKESQDRMDRELRSEIKDALLRVVEILGVFMAVAGVAATTVGGALATDSALQALIVYGCGGVTVLGLFVMLRLIVHGPEGFRRRASVAADTSNARQSGR